MRQMCIGGKGVVVLCGSHWSGAKWMEAKCRVGLAPPKKLALLIET